jgi:hypothetical protein
MFRINFSLFAAYARLVKCKGFCFGGHLNFLIKRQSFCPQIRAGFLGEEQPRHRPAAANAHPRFDFDFQPSLWDLWNADSTRLSNAGLFPLVPPGQNLVAPAVNKNVNRFSRFRNISVTQMKDN